MGSGDPRGAGLEIISNQTCLFPDGPAFASKSILPVQPVRRIVCTQDRALTLALYGVLQMIRQLRLTCMLQDWFVVARL